jgi:hypothetical protein
VIPTEPVAYALALIIAGILAWAVRENRRDRRRAHVLKRILGA